jgi:hypothetical protein
MSVGEWVAKLTTDSVDQPPPKAETTRDDPKPWWRSTAAQRISMWVAILITIGLLAYNGRRPQPRPAIANHRAPALVQRHPPAAVADVRQVAPLAVEPPLPAQVPSKAAARPVGPAAAQATNSVDQNLDALSVVGFRVPPGQGFAEVSVRRADPENGERGFVWWTVAGSAVPGLDFASQTPTPQAFSRGRRASNIFVRLLPNPLRTSARDFHVEIGKADSDDIAAPVARTTIAIPPQP